MVNTYYKTVIKTREEWIGNVVRPTPIDEGTVNCFTDGSKDDHSSGCAYIIRGSDFKSQYYRNLGKDTTVFQAEITALADTAEDLLGRNITDKNIDIYIDSQAAIKALSKYIISQKTVFDCKTLINKVCKRNNVRLIWIPSHVGHLGNEIADRLAKLGSGTNTYGPALLRPVPISVSVTKQLLSEWAEKEHQVFWARIEGHRQSKMMMPKVNSKIWKCLRAYNRIEIKVLCYILTGHAALKRHLTLMDTEETSLCDCGEGDEETVYHFLGECPAFNNIRYNIFGYHYLNTDQVSSLKIKDIIKYLKKTGRFDEILH